MQVIMTVLLVVMGLLVGWIIIRGIILGLFNLLVTIITDPGRILLLLAILLGALATLY